MLAELSAANAAFAIIKQAVTNAGDVARAGSALTSFATAKEDLEKKLRGKNKAAANQSDLEAFLALEQIKQYEKDLKEIMIYTGRPGLWADWQGFQAEARKERREAELKAERRKEFMAEIVVGFLATIIFIGIVGTAVYVLRG
jgi:hypothetical protein